MSFMCIQCGEDTFDTMSSLTQHIKNIHVATIRDRGETFEDQPPAPVEQGSLVPSNPALPEPIVLTYVFTGQCPTCRTYVETLELEVEGKLFMVAYCSTCKVKVFDKKVIPIDQMSEIAPPKVVHGVSTKK
jgi:hypothetical protein